MIHYSVETMFKLEVFTTRFNEPLIEFCNSNTSESVHDL